MVQRTDIRVGMAVESRDGQRLGRVIGLEGEAFVVEKGVFFPRDYHVDFRDVATVQGDDIVLARDREELRKADWGEVMDVTSGLHLGPRDLEAARMDSSKFQDHRRYDLRPSEEPSEEEEEGHA